MDGREDLLGGAGRDPAAPSTVKGYRYVGGQLQQLPVTFTPFPAMRHGVNVTGGAHGF